MANILVVDDDPTARDLVVTILGYVGHQLRQAADGAEALIEAQTRAPDLIIADLLMPTMDGFEFVRRLREHAALAQTPVIFYTATYLESEARHLAWACGVTHIITKPAEPQQILDAVSRNLGTLPTPIAPPPLEEFRQRHMGLLLAKLSQKAESVVPRLDAMIELCLQLASERDPQQLLGNFCAAARKVIGAKYATVGLLDKEHQGLRYLFASGMSPETAARLGSPQLRTALPSGVFSERQSRRLRGLSGNPEAVGLPIEHPPIHSFLCAPIVSPDRVYGWLCLADKLGATEFNDEDEGLAQILAAQVGRIYENGSLYADVKRYVAELEAEVAERKRAQEEIRQLNADLEKRVAERTAALQSANQELEAFSYSVSHDLRGPLRRIQGYCQILLQDHAPSLPEPVQNHLRSIGRSARHMGELIHNLLNLSRISRHELRHSSVHLSEIARQILDELKQSNPARQVECRITTDPLVDGDPKLLRIALDNLLGNAWKFTQNRSIGRIEMGASEQETETVFFVRDNGAGFDMTYADKLFGAFQRLHRPDEFEGTGIGLAIVQRIIARHGGRVWAEAKVDEGATFYFSLSKAQRKQP